MQHTSLWSCAALALVVSFGGSAAARQGGQMQTFGGQEERMSTRVLYFTGNGSPGGVFIDWGAPEWKAEYDATLDQMTKGKRVRFGKGFWTCFDTNVPLQSGQTKIGPGLYYCALERSADDKWSLLLLDPGAIRAKKLDAFQTGETEGGTRIELKHEMVKDSAVKLDVALNAGKEDARTIALGIHWGTHKLSAQLNAQL